MLCLCEMFETAGGRSPLRPGAGEMQLFVVLPSVEVVEVQLASDRVLTLADLKAAVEAETGVGAAQQQLVHAGQTLGPADAMSLADAGVEPGATLQLGLDGLDLAAAVQRLATTIEFAPMSTRLAGGVVENDMAELAALLLEYPYLNIFVEGHCDPSAVILAPCSLLICALSCTLCCGLWYPNHLTRGRARAITRALVGHGVAAERVHSQGFGGRFPVPWRDTKRVEIYLQTSDGQLFPPGRHERMPPIEIDRDRLRAAVTDAITAGRRAPPGVRIELRGAAAVPCTEAPAGAPVSGSGYYLGFKKGGRGRRRSTRSCLMTAPWPRLSSGSCRWTSGLSCRTRCTSPQSWLISGPSASQPGRCRR